MRSRNRSPLKQIDSIKIGDLVSFKPKYYGDSDWSNPGIVLDSYRHRFKDTVHGDELVWIVWVDGNKYMVNERNDDVIHVTKKYSRNPLVTKKYAERT